MAEHVSPLIGRPKQYAGTLKVALTRRQINEIRQRVTLHGGSAADIVRAALDAYLFPEKQQ